MDTEELVRRIYLGDRAVTGYELRSWADEFRIYIDSISVINGDSWVPDEDPEYPHAKLLFKGVKSVSFSPAGALPNDYIDELKYRKREVDGFAEFELRCSSTDDVESVSVTITVVADTLSLKT